MSLIFKEVPRQGLAVTTSKDIGADPTRGASLVRVTADVVIVGSGSGGAVMAYELARTGKRVVVLEAGPYVASTQFNENFSDALALMYVAQGAQTNTWGDVLVEQGMVIGGSSNISATISQRAPDWKFAEWADRFGLADINLKTLGPHYERIEQRLYVHENEAHEINECANTVVRGCERLGYEWKPAQRNVKQCALTGFCLAGCPSDRKMSMLVTYLPWAVAEGAKLYADTHVVRVRTLNGRATGVDAEVIDKDTGRKVADMRVDAQLVVLAAGAVQTPQILQRSNYPDFGDQVGRNFSGHPMAQIIARYPEPVYGWRGALTGVVIEEFLPPAKGGYMFYSGLSGPEQLLTAHEHGSGQEHIEFMRNLKYYASLNAFVRDDNHGRVRWIDKGNGKGEQRINFLLSRADVDNLKKATSIAARIHFAAGAEKVYLPTFEKLAAGSVFELDALIDKIIFGLEGMYTFRTLSIHPQGTARMGADPAYSVVRPTGETHEISGLFVADASLFPSGLVVSPQTTVHAMASYIAQEINSNERNYFI